MRRQQIAERWLAVMGPPWEGSDQPESALKVPVEEQDDYRRLASRAAVLGRDLENLAAAASRVAVPAPAAFGSQGPAWSDFEAAGVALREWAVLLLCHLPFELPMDG